MDDNSINKQYGDVTLPLLVKVLACPHLNLT